MFLVIEAFWVMTLSLSELFCSDILCRLLDPDAEGTVIH